MMSNNIGSIGSNNPMGPRMWIKKTLETDFSVKIFL